VIEETQNKHQLVQYALGKNNFPRYLHSFKFKWQHKVTEKLNTALLQPVS